MYPSASHAFAAAPQFAVTDTASLVAALPGCWTLGAGRALSMRASQAGDLCVARGRIWVTFDNAAVDSSGRAGDYFVGEGESLLLAAGQSLVMESFDCGDAAPAYFRWEPALQRSAPPGWVAGVGQPLLDLRAALALAAGAAGRLARGLVGNVVA